MPSSRRQDREDRTLRMLPLTVSGQPLEISLERLGQPMSLYVPLSKGTLQGVQGVPAAELLVGGTGRRAALGVPRRQCPGWLPAASGAEGLPGRGGGHRHNQGLSASAGYQQDLLLYCGEGKDARFGVIEFAVSADVTEGHRPTPKRTLTW